MMNSGLEEAIGHWHAINCSSAFLPPQSIHLPHDEFHLIHQGPQNNSRCSTAPSFHSCHDLPSQKTPGIKQLDTFHVLRLELGGGHKSDEVLGLGPCLFPVPFALIFLGEELKLKNFKARQILCGFFWSLWTGKFQTISSHSPLNTAESQQSLGEAVQTLRWSKGSFASWSCQQGDTSALQISAEMTESLNCHWQ